MLKGVQVSEYRGQKQYGTTLKFDSRTLKQHTMRKYLREFDNMDFTNLSGNTNADFKDAHYDCQTLVERMEELDNGETLWTELICTVFAIRTGGSKGVYLSCPECRKKVEDDTERTVCPFCDKYYIRPKHRYLITVGLSDSTN